MPTAGIVAARAGTLVGDARRERRREQLLAMSRSWTTERPTTVLRCVSLFQPTGVGGLVISGGRHSSIRRSVPA